MKNKNLWFKAKNYGWGWVPVTWQGWLVIIIFVYLATVNFLKVNSITHSVSDALMNYFFRLFFLILALLLVCYLKGKKPEWRWGGKKTKL